MVYPETGYLVTVSGDFVAVFSNDSFGNKVAGFGNKIACFGNKCGQALSGC